MIVVQLEDRRRVNANASAGFSGPVEQQAVAGPVCGNCGDAGPAKFEMSRLIEHEGELTDTQLIGMFEYCARCAGLVARGDWSDLVTRS